MEFGVSQEVVEVLSELNRNLRVLIRMKLEQYRGDRSQKDMILFLNSCGCGPKEIAELLDTTTNAVSPVLSRAGRKTKGK